MTRETIPTIRTTTSWTFIVRLLRIAGPTMLIGIVFYILFWSYFKSTPYLQMLEDKLKQTNLLVNLKLISTDDHGNPVRINARTAHDIGHGKAILNAPSSDFTTEDGTNMHLSADAGNLDKDKNSLALKGSVDLKTKTGYELKAPSAIMDLRNHSTESFEPVYGKGLKGEIQSDKGIKITPDGDIFFKGNTTLTINPSSDNPLSELTSISQVPEPKTKQKQRAQQIHENLDTQVSHKLSTAAEFPSDSNEKESSREGA